MEYTERQTDRQQSDLITFLLFFKNKYANEYLIITPLNPPHIPDGNPTNVGVSNFPILNNIPSYHGIKMINCHTYTTDLFINNMRLGSIK
jgi:hypothetical protein